MKTIQAIRGMNDLLPQDLVVWHYVEQQVKQIFNNYSYQEIRLPILEPTALFKRGVGEVTDIVEKEMFTFLDRDNESISLRPEGTAGCVRAGIQHGLLYNQEQKLWYQGQMFRYERPQKGRYRQFHQFGCEVFGIADAMMDLELLLLTKNLWQQLGLTEYVSLEINSIGSIEARNNYKVKLVEFLQQHLDVLDEDSKRRLTTNPLRILDTKNPDIQAILVHAPKLNDYLDEESKRHFSELCNLLDQMQVDYTINPNLVRGLDYYNKTVFEWVTNKLGAQGTVCAGGRYDGLVELLGGKATPAVGFAIGIERLVLLVKEIYPDLINSNSADIYVVFDGNINKALVISYTELLRQHLANIKIMLNCSGGKFNKQLKKADKSGAKFAIIFGETEIAEQQVVIKNLQTGEQISILQQESFNYLKSILEE